MRPLLALLLVFATSALNAAPNVLWFVVDDMSANFSCYGEQLIQTPHVDRLAKEGTRFSRAYITAPVCSPCRSALITGMYQTSIGAHHHRSGRGELRIQLPGEVTPLPALMQKAGYHTCIGSGLKGEMAHTDMDTGRRLGKTDYNFDWDPAMYDGEDWSSRKEGQPFFMQVQLSGGKLRDGGAAKVILTQKKAAAIFGSPTQPEAVTLPPYYPRDPVILADWAAYLDAVRLTDHHVGQVLARLENEGLLANTLIIFLTDHGISHARGKQFLYNEGTHVPLVIRGPGIKAGAVRDDLVNQIDLPAITLAAIGQTVPAWMQGKDVLAAKYEARTAVFAARDRCDETVERIRSMRTPDFLYIRNYHPQRPHLQPNAYKDGKPTVQRLRELHEKKQLPELSEQLLFSDTRPTDELYDTRTDPWQIKNLASDPAHADTLKQMQSGLDQWIKDSGDKGPETEAMYDSDMAVYLSGKWNAKARKTAKPNPTEANVVLMKQWAKEGK
jgi:arylsulfatase A-like enzyme